MLVSENPAHDMFLYPVPEELLRQAIDAILQPGRVTASDVNFLCVTDKKSSIDIYCIDEKGLLDGLLPRILMVLIGTKTSSLLRTDTNGRTWRLEK